MNIKVKALKRSHLVLIEIGNCSDLVKQEWDLIDWREWCYNSHKRNQYLRGDVKARMLSFFSWDVFLQMAFERIYRSIEL